jgi:hypothetical protein
MVAVLWLFKVLAMMEDLGERVLVRATRRARNGFARSERQGFQQRHVSSSFSTLGAE